MGGVILEVNGTAYGDAEELYEAWQKAIAAKAGFIGGFANDTIDTEIDGIVITIRREFLVRPDQLSVNVVPTVATKDGWTTTGLNVRPTPDTTQKPVATLAKGTAITVVDAPGAWLKLVTPYAGNWVSAAYVTFVRPT